VYDALASIPEALRHASTYVQTYTAHTNIPLVQKTASLCKSILVILNLGIDFITKTSLSEYVCSRIMRTR
jgi:hypothetical protein